MSSYGGSEDVGLAVLLVEIGDENGSREGLNACEMGLLVLGIETCFAIELSDAVLCVHTCFEEVFADELGLVEDNSVTYILLVLKLILVRWVVK